MKQSLSRLRQSLRPDIFAGFTVAMVAIPQSMAYAALAGVAPIYGLYTAIIPTIAGALFGSSSHLVTGPTNATALVTANVLLSHSSQAGYLEFVCALAILAGLIKLALGVLRLGGFIGYVSNSVLTGFLTGAAILIILGQLVGLFGLPSAPGQGTLALAQHLAASLAQVNLHAFLIGLATVVFVLSFKRINRKLPAELLAVGASGILVHVLGWQSLGVRVVSDLGTLHDISFVPHVPAISISDWQQLAPSAGAIAMFSLVEAMSIAKSVALTSGDSVNPSREFLAQGLASLAGGFFHAIPSSGSLARTATNYASGGRTRVSALLAGCFVLLSLLAFGPLLAYIPVTSLAAVVIVSAWNLIDRHRLRLTWQSQASSRAVMSVTLAATLLAPLHYAIYLGALLSIAIYVYESSKLELSYITRDPAGGFVEHSLDDILRTPPSIAIVNVEGTLSFGAAEDLEQRVDLIIRSGVRVVILRLRRVRLLSSTGVAALERIVAYAHRSGTRVLVCGIKGEVEATLHSSGVESMIGEQEVFRASDVLFASTQHALARAQDIVLASDGHFD